RAFAERRPVEEAHHDGEPDREDCEDGDARQRWADEAQRMAGLGPREGAATPNRDTHATPVSVGSLAEALLCLAEHVRHGQLTVIDTDKARLNEVVDLLPRVRYVLALGVLKGCVEYSFDIVAVLLVDGFEV